MRVQEFIYIPKLLHIKHTVFKLCVSSWVLVPTDYLWATAMPSSETAPHYSAGKSCSIFQQCKHSRPECAPETQNRVARCAARVLWPPHCTAALALLVFFLFWDKLSDYFRCVYSSPIHLGLTFTYALEIEPIFFRYPLVKLGHCQ